MTLRQYYADPYIREFNAQVVETTTHAGQPALVLDATYFYPTGGGQPHDMGSLDGVPVCDVVLREDDGAVLHLLEAPLAATDAPLTGVIDWRRRFDHMQQHTGQHILSRAFEVHLDAPTVGFHLSENNVTIDVDIPDLSPADLATVEELANAVVMRDAPVKAWFPPEDELAALPLRKISEKVTGAVRVVGIGDFDVCACGGTHVARAGEVGQIKILRADRQKSVLRVTFVCGWRALADYRAKNDLLLALSAQMTAAYTDLPDLLSKMTDENKAQAKQIKSLRGQVLRYEADDIWREAAADTPDGARVVIAGLYPERGAGDLSSLAAHLASHPRTVALLGIPGDKAHLVFASSPDLNYDVVPLLKAVLETLGTSRGGGRPTLAQGGGFPASVPQLESVLDYAAGRARRGD